MRFIISWILGVALISFPASRTAHARQDADPPQETTSESDAAQPAPGHSIHGEAFNEGPRQKAHLMPGMGKVHFPVSTAQTEAQAFIDQGVAQLHSFYYLEAERSFRQAASSDPDCAFAYWGMAMANTNNEARAKKFLEVAHAKSKARPVTRREQLYLDGLSARYKEGSDAKARRQAWLGGLETIVQEFPADLDARAWLAMVAWENSRQDGIGSRQAVDSLLEAVLAVDPMHPGAHHYVIHLWDNIKPEQAVYSATQYARAAPGIAHAWHMPGHTFTGLKRYAEAAYQQEGSARVDHEMMRRERLMPFEIHNYAHNNQWLSTSLSHVGRVRDAVAVARDLAEQPRDPKKNGADNVGSAQRYGRKRWTEALVRYELWDELLNAADSGALDWSDQVAERVDRIYLTGLAHAAKNDQARLAAQIAALKTLIEEETRRNAEVDAKNVADATDPDKSDGDAKKSDNTTDPADATADDVKDPTDAKDAGSAEGEKPANRRRPRRVPGADTALNELEGRLKLARGEIDAAFEHFKKASSMRKESLALAYLAAGKREDAEKTAREHVDRNEGQVPPLIALIEVLQAIGKTSEAREAYARLAPLLRGADRDNPPMRRLETILDAWRASGDWEPPSGATVDSIGAAAAGRLDLETVGPLTWSPYAAEPLNLVDTDGVSWSLEEHRGKVVVLLFYLGGGCAHCMQQLQLFSDASPRFAEAGIEVVAISTDDAETTRTLKNNEDGIRFRMPLLANPGLGSFHAYRCYDDFEDQPLHGTFVVDPEGGVRYHNISYEPFLDVDFVLEEAQRVARLHGRSRGREVLRVAAE